MPQIQSRGYWCCYVAIYAGPSRRVCLFGHVAGVYIFRFSLRCATAPAPGRRHSARQHVPVDEYGRNLREMVSYMRATGISRILLLTPPPVWAPGRRKHMLWVRGANSMSLATSVTDVV